MYRKRFGLTGHPLPKDARGKTFFDKAPVHDKLNRAFTRLLDEPGLGIVTGDPGVGKTTALRNRCAELPKPDYLVLYICDTAVSPLDLYRALAQDLGIKPSHRRGQLWTDIKRGLVHMVDERHTAPILVLDEAHHLSDKFLVDLSGFLNFAFDSRDLLTVWLVGQPALRKALARQEHAALATRVAAHVHFDPFLDKDAFVACILAALAAVGATEKIVADAALELLFRQSRGFLRVAGKILRAALRIAHDREQSFVDEATMTLAVEDVIAPPPPRAPKA
jgi:type II secretory pathway predicted ATPase ExeA